MTAVDNARAAQQRLKVMIDRYPRDASPREVAAEEALRELIAEHERLTCAAKEAVDLIGNQSGDLNGAALDAWRILTDAMRPDHTDGA